MSDWAVDAARRLYTYLVSDNKGFTVHVRRDIDAAENALVSALRTAHKVGSDEAAAEITALRERVEKLEAALRPFAEEAARYEPPEGDDEQLLWGEFKLTIGSLRRARAAFEGK